MEGRPPIAVVGIGTVFPGADSPSEFWQNILEKRELCREAPPGRWTLDPKQALAVGAEPDKVCSLRGCFVEGFALDTRNLSIDPELLKQLDPLYWFVLHAGRQAFEDGSTGNLDRARTSVILAAIALPTDGSSAITRETFGADFKRRLLERLAEIRGAPVRPTEPSSRTHPLNARVTGLPASVLAEALELGGGSYTLDAACASSLYAVKLACDDLQAGRVDAVLAGGVSRPDCLYTQMGFSQLSALSPSGRCAPFDSAADGLVVGEGAGIVLLKRLDRAVTDGDRIYGVIRGIGLSNDIGGSLLAPDTEGQVRSMREAYRRAEWSPNAVDLVECHGTGTPLGDAVEIASLREVWRDETWAAGQCPIGSIKSMIGHLLTAAGAAGLIKVLLAMQQRTLPPSANFHKPGKDLGLEDSAFRVQTEAADWRRRDDRTPRRAAVSAFGFGGINAHVLIEEWVSEGALTVKTAPKLDTGSGMSVPMPLKMRTGPDESAREPVAIVGMSARFGHITSLPEFQELVLQGETAIGTRPDDRWRGCEKTLSEAMEQIDFPGAYLERLSIPVGKYRLPPSEIPEILTQQLLMLESVADALGDAGLPLSERRPRAGIIVGMAFDMDATDFQLRWWLKGAARRWAAEWGFELNADEEEAWIDALRAEAGPALNPTRTVGALGGIIASRIARECRFGGPSFGVSCEEASGLRAVEIAVRSLRLGEVDLAVAGAVDPAGDPRAVMTSGQLRKHLSAGDVRPFDDSAEGTAVGEGAAAVVLKRLSDARRDGDRIYAVIRGIGSATGGGIETGSASTTAYASALDRAYADAGISPETVDYVETHGSGDELEDRTEAAALLAHFQGREHPLALGSVKPNIGHCGAAAGMASFVKAAICLYQEILPPMRGFTQPCAGPSWDPDVIHVPRQPTFWLRDRIEGLRRAGVSAMTIDGNCAHVVLEAAENQTTGRKTERTQPLGARSSAVFVVTGDDVEGLLVGLRDLERCIAVAPSRIEAIARGWFQSRRPEDEHSLAVAMVAASLEDLAAAQQCAVEHLQSRPSKGVQGRCGVYYSPDPLGQTGQTAFVFPGSGNHYVGMGREIGANWPEVLRALDATTDRLSSQLMGRWFQPQRLSWLPGWEKDAEAAAAVDLRRMIFGQVSFGMVMNDLVRRFGVRPDAIIGYSLGESAGLFASRAWADSDEMLRRMTASTLFQTDLAFPYDAIRDAWNLGRDERVDWMAAVVRRPVNVVAEALRGVERARLLIVNTPRECVIGGLRPDVQAVGEELGCKLIPVEGVPTVHFEAVSTVEDDYREMHLLDTTPPPSVRFYSCALGRAYTVDRTAAADSITDQALHGFDFTRVVGSAYDDGVRVFVELGPQASCTRMIREILGDRPHFAMSANAKGEDEVGAVLGLLAGLIAERVPVDLDELYGRESHCVGHRIEREAESEKAMVVVPVGGKAPDPPLPKGFGEMVRPAATLPSESPESEHVSIGSVFGGPPVAGRLVSSARATPLREPPDDDLVFGLERSTVAAAGAHRAFLSFSQAATEGMGKALEYQGRLLNTLLRDGCDRNAVRSMLAEPAPERDSASIPIGPRHGRIALPAVRLPREKCLEFAVGSLANVLGRDFAEADTYPVRVRLPAEPLMLVDRILSIEGEPGSLTSGKVITEHDVLPGAWYLDGGRCPISIAVEAGQADLFLCAYLGIDAAVKGRRAYRLLDAVVTFHRDLPRPGDAIRYEIEIERFVKQGETYLFFFRFDGRIDGDLVLTMRDGCAGFFTDEEIEDSGGIILTADETAPDPRSHPADWRELATLAAESYADEQVAALRAGDLAGCFGRVFAELGLRDPLGLPDGRMKLFDRVLELNPKGGRFGLGIIRAEADIHADDWFLTCHFVDDMTMPGTLMYECCVHALRFYLLRMGWIGEREGVSYQPIAGISSALKCRGPVTPKTKKVIYEVEIKELGYRPEPYVIADALMYADGRRVVQMKDIAIRVAGLSREQIEATWATAERVQGEPPEAFAPIARSDALPAKQSIFDRDRILAFAVGKPSEAFGEPYRIFDADRRIARLPGPPYQFLDRIVAIEPEAWKLEPGGWIEAEYDVPPDAWYFRANRQVSMPYCVLLEIALQPCGWLAAYLGSALRSETDLSFRNLSGKAILNEEIYPDAGTLNIRVRLTNVAEAGGMIIENFDFHLHRAGKDVFRGETSFGFFSAEALARQVGIRDAAERAFVPSEADIAGDGPIDFGELPPLTPDDPEGLIAVAASLPANALRMIDRVELLIPDGGPQGLGYIRGSAVVDPSDWFYAAHFHQDPVWPGSLGLESLLQLLKVVAIERWGAEAMKSHRFAPIILGAEHEWNYRGQIIPTNKRVEVEAVVTEIRDGRRPMIRANGLLKVDGTYIYEMVDFGLELIQVDT